MLHNKLFVDLSSLPKRGDLKTRQSFNNKYGGNAARENPCRGPICYIINAEMCTSVDLSSLSKRGDLKIR
jgi:hypothetical protein